MTETAPIPENLGERTDYALALLDGETPPKSKKSERVMTISPAADLTALGDLDAAEPASEERDAPADDAEDEEGREPAEPAIQPPASWSADAKSKFAELPPDLQTEIVRRESERDRGVNQRLNEIAAERQAIQTERQRAARDLDTLIQTAALTDPILVEGMATDWQRLAQTNPALHQQKFAAFQRRLGDIQAAARLKDQLDGETMRARAEREKAALAEKLPEWSEPQTREKLVADLKSHLPDWGFEEAELNGLLDHRLLLLALDAVRYRQLKADPKSVAAKKVADLPRVQRPGMRPEGMDETSRLASQKRAALKSGRLDKQVDFVLRALTQES
jgi:hypothetical protein